MFGGGGRSSLSEKLCSEFFKVKECWIVNVSYHKKFLGYKFLMRLISVNIYVSNFLALMFVLIGVVL